MACQSNTPCNMNATASRPLGRAARRSALLDRCSIHASDEEVERDDGAVQYEPFGAQWHENLYHAPARPLFILLCWNS
jgi:hypothetical protein